MPKSLSVSIRLQRVTTETAHVSIELVPELMRENQSGSLVIDTERLMQAATEQGVLKPVGNQLWGDRVGWMADPQGHVWALATRTEETTEEELRKRWAAMLLEPETKG